MLYIKTVPEYCIYFYVIKLFKNQTWGQHFNLDLNAFSG